MKEHPIIFSTDMVKAILDGIKTMTRRTYGLEWVNQIPDAWKFLHMEGDIAVFKLSVTDLPLLYSEPVAVPQRSYPLIKGIPTRHLPDAEFHIKCPYGQVGDREWQSGMPPQDDYYYVKDFAEDKPVYLRRFLPEDYPNEDVEAGLLWGWDERDDPEAIELEGLSLETIRWKRVGDRLWVRETFCQVCYKKDGIQDVCYKEDLETNLSGVRCHCKYTSSRFMPRWAFRITLEITGIRVERLQDITREDAIREGAFLVGTEINGGYVFNQNETPALSAPTAFAFLWETINAKRGYSWENNNWVWVIGIKRLDDDKIPALSV